MGLVSAIGLGCRLRRIGYVDGNSAVHRLDPITKMVVLLCFCLLALAGRDEVTVVIALVTVFSLIWATGLGLVSSLRKVWTIILLCFLLFVLQISIHVRHGRLAILDYLQ